MTDHVCLYVIVKVLRDEMCRRNRAKPVVDAEVPFNYGQCAIDMGARAERSQSLCNFRDSNSAPYIEEVVSVLVLCPVPKGKGLEDGKGTRTAHRNAPGSPCTGRCGARQLFPAPVLEGQFKTWCDYRGQVGFDMENLTSLIRFIGGRNQEVYRYRMGLACGPGLESHISMVIDVWLESRVSQPDAQLSIALPIQNGQG